MSAQSVIDLCLPELEALESLADISPTLNQFIERAWHIVEPATVYSPGWHIDAMCEHLTAVKNGQIKKLIINVPPRTSKSTIMSVCFPAWCWIDQPSLRFLYASYSADLSKFHSVQCRRLIESNWYLRRWGNIFRLASDQNEKFFYENTKAGYRLATSVGGSNTGRGGDILGFDDPNNAKEAESEVALKEANDWTDGVMSTRHNDPKNAREIIVQQRVNENDVSGHLMERGGYETLKLPMEYEPVPFVYVTKIGWKDPRSKPGELLCPNRYDKESVEALKKNLGSHRAAGQLQQRPAPMTGGMFKQQWWKFWQPAGQSYKPYAITLEDGSIHHCPVITLECDRNDTPKRLTNWLQSWDFAFKATDDSAYVCGQVWGQIDADNILVDEVRKKLTFTETLTALIELTKKYPQTTTKLVEEKANGAAVIDVLSHKVSGIIPINPTESKEARASAVSPIMESGNVYLPHPSWKPWVQDFILEFTNFPNGTYKDRVDTTSQALRRLNPTTGFVIAAGPGVKTQMDHAAELLKSIMR